MANDMRSEWQSLGRLKHEWRGSADLAGQRSVILQHQSVMRGTQGCVVVRDAVALAGFRGEFEARAADISCIVTQFELDNLRGASYNQPSQIGEVPRKVESGGTP